MQDKRQGKSVEPFNEVTEHYQKIMGVPNKKVDLNTMPKPLRYFYYFFMAFLTIGAIALLLIFIYK